MREIVRTDDLVLLSYLESLLRQAGIQAVVFDRNISALPGGVGVLPQRVMVEDDRWEAARRVLVEAGLGKWIINDGQR